MKKRLLAALTAFVIIVSAGCGSSNTNPPAGTPAAGQENDTVRESIVIKDTEEWGGTDMFQCDSWTNVQTIIAATFVNIDPDTGALLPNIASKVEVSEDGLTMRLTFPEGMYYATGEQVEPEDFVASINYGQEVSPYNFAYSNIESMEIEERDVVCHLSYFRSDLDYFIASAFMGLIDKDQIDSMTREELLWGAVPYGPYYVDEFVAGSHVTLKANPGYVTHDARVQNKGVPYVKNVTVNFADTEEFTIVTGIQEGDYDFLSAIMPESVLALTGNPDVVVVEATYPNVEYFEMNTRVAPFDDVKVREAVMLAINREQLTELCNGAARPAYSIIIDTVQNYSQKAADDFKEIYCNNPDKAKQLLAEAGYADSDNDGYLDKDGNILEFTYLVGTGGVRMTTAQALQMQLKEIGVSMKIEQIEWNYRYERISSGNYQAGGSSFGWGEPILYFGDSPESGGCMNDTGTVPDNRKDEYYRLVNECFATPNYDARSELVGQVQMLMYENKSIVPIYSTNDFTAYRKDLHGLYISDIADFLFNDVK